MLVFVLEVLGPISKIGFSCQAGGAYYSHRPVYSSKTNSWIFLSDEFIKIANCGVFFCLQEYIEDLLSLCALHGRVREFFGSLLQRPNNAMAEYKPRRSICYQPRRGQYSKRCCRFRIKSANYILKKHYRIKKCGMRRQIQ